MLFKVIGLRGHTRTSRIEYITLAYHAKVAGLTCKKGAGRSRRLGPQVISQRSVNGWGLILPKWR
jgi:hypothetical protein